MTQLTISHSILSLQHKSSTLLSSLSSSFITLPYSISQASRLLSGSITHSLSCAPHSCPEKSEAAVLLQLSKECLFETQCELRDYYYQRDT